MDEENLTEETLCVFLCVEDSGREVIIVIDEESNINVYYCFFFLFLLFFLLSLVTFPSYSKVS